MAGNILSGYGTTNQNITISLANLADNTAQQSDVIDNSTTLFTDVLVMLTIRTTTGTDATSFINVYVYGTVNTTTPTYSSGATGADGSFTLAPGGVMLPLGHMGTPGVNTSYTTPLYSVASAFGGSMPQKWGIIVENQTNNVLDTTESNHLKKYQGIYGTYT